MATKHSDTVTVRGISGSWGSGGARRPWALSSQGTGVKDSSGYAATEEIRRDALPTLTAILVASQCRKRVPPFSSRLTSCTAEVQNTAKQ
jgi:hypothetical protein